MFRLIAKWWAKQSYRWQLETEAGKNEVNAKLAAKNAQVKRDFVVQLNKEADDIEANIKTVEDEENARKETDEYKL